MLSTNTLLPDGKTQLLYSRISGINDVQQLNKVTVRDSRMPSAPDEFSEGFACYPIVSVINYFSGYYQIKLAIHSRNITAFLTTLQLFQITLLLQGWVLINSNTTKLLHNLEQ
jgi:hypothetical protein